MHSASRDARRAQRLRRQVVALLIAIVSLGTAASTAFAGGQILVYTGNGAIVQGDGYVKFAASAGRTRVASPVLPITQNEWDSYQCIVLPVNQVGFDEQQRTDLLAYANRGGTIVALAEHQFADNNMVIGPTSTTTMNNLASTTGIQALNTSVNTSGQVTTDIVPSKYTAGVTAVGFAGTTTLTVTQPALAMVRTIQDGPVAPTPFLAIRELGAGKFVYSGDSNVFSDAGRYTAQTSNAALARNICGDINPPDVTITTPADGARYKKGYTAPNGAEWGCTDPDSDVDPTKTTATTAAGLPFDTTVPPVGPQTVTKTFTVSCTDNVGNKATKTVTYTVDGSPPTAAIDTPVNLETYGRNSVVPALWTCTDPDGPTDIDTAPSKTFGTVASGTAIDTSMPGGLPVTKPFSVTCRDKAGNVDTKDVSYTVEDLSPPVAAIATPANGARFPIGKQPLLAAWTCKDPDDTPSISDIDTVASFGTLPVGDQVDTSGTSGQTVQKTFTVFCQDLAGKSSTATSTYYVDGSPPTVTIAVPIDGGTYARGSSQPASWGCTDADGDGDVKSKVGTVPVGTPINTSTLGEKSFTVTCTDQAGNVGSKLVKYTVVGGPPVVNIVVPSNGATYSQGQVVSPSYTCTDPDGDLKSCLREGGATGPLDTSKGGSFKFTVNAEDVPGNKAAKTVSYTVVTKPGTTGSGVSPTATPGGSKTTKACSSRRQFRIRVKKLKGGVSAVSATVFVNGKKTLTRKGKRVTAIVTLKGLKKGRYTVKINVKYSNGRVLSYTRKFKTCTPKGK